VPVVFGCARETAKITDADLAVMVEANHAQLVDDFCPAWSAAPAAVVVLAIGAASEIACHLRDARADDPLQALAFHTVEGGAPAIHVLVDRILAQPGAALDDVSCALGHELMECLGDAFCDLWSNRGDGTEEPREVVDRVQGGRYIKTLHRSDGSTIQIAVSNFLLPEAFNDDAPAGTKFDWVGQLKHPRDIAPGGYTIINDTTTSAKTVFGDHRAALAFSQGALVKHGVDVAALRGAP